MSTWQEALKIETSSEPLRSMTVDELRDEQGKIVGALKSLLDQCEAEKRDINSAEESAFKGAEKYLDEIKAEHAKRPANQPPAMSATYGEGAKNTSIIRGGCGLTYRELWYGRKDASVRNEMDPEEFFKSATEKRGTGSDFIPESYMSDVYDATLALSGLLSYVKVLPVEAGNSLHVGLFDNEDQSGGAHFGGVVTSWKAEGATFTEVDPKTRSVEFQLKKCGQYISVTREMMEGYSGDFAPVLSEKMTYALNAEAEAAIINGTGVGRPTGILNSPATITIGRTTSNSIEWADIAKMMTRLHPALHQQAIFICNQEALEKLMTMVDSAGNFIWTPNFSSGAAAAVPQRLAGLPLVISDEAAALGSAGDLILANLGMYGWAMKKKVVFESTLSYRWAEDMYSYRAIYRMDGKSLLSQPLTAAHGSNTLSAFVVLGA